MNIYKYFKIGQQPTDIKTDYPLELKELEKLMNCTDWSFIPLKNGNTLCVDSEGVIKNLPYNRAFSEKDTDADIGYGLRGNIIEGKVNKDEEFVGV